MAMRPDPDRPREVSLAPSSSDARQRREDSLFAVFVLGVVLFSPVVFGLFDRGANSTVFGVPVLYAFVFTAWAVLVALIATIVRGAPDATDEPAEMYREDNHVG